MKIINVAIALCAMTGVASADAHTEKKKAPDTKDAKKAPDAKDAKKAPDAKDAKKAPKPEAPKPAAEVDAMAKQVVGTWKCKGESTEMDGSKTKIDGTMTSKLDLDKFWIADTIVIKGGMGYKANAFTTYDGAAKKWRRVSVNAMGGYMVGTSDGMKDNKMSWSMDMVGAMGTGQFRDHIDATDAKAGVKMWGEMSMDKGKTWNKVYELSCKK